MKKKKRRRRKKKRKKKNKKNKKKKKELSDNPGAYSIGVEVATIGIFQR